MLLQTQKEKLHTKENIYTALFHTMTVYTVHGSVYGVYSVYTVHGLDQS